ncbi:MAG: hypothetical protein LBT19_02865 [Candidatus Nomurabacteria bacterium]|jgi:hypothetical protein|nr:hypothetical protein [Candidatus Nomurabacteria bacterium]
MSIIKYLTKLYQEHRELALLQWTYLALAATSILVAGIFALFNQSLGVSILIVPLVAFIAISMNIIAWALIKLAAETFLNKPLKTTPKKK